MTTPRIAPLDLDDRAPAQWPADVRDGVTAFDPEGPPSSLVRTLARHPAALAGIGPLAAYIREQSMVTAVDRMLLALRMAWLSRSEALWAELAAEARTVGLRQPDLRRVAEGPGAGWGEWDNTILRMADELYRDSTVSDTTWSELVQRYNDRQLLDGIFVAAEYSMLSMMANSWGVLADARFPDRLPTDVARTVGRPRPAPVRPDAARLGPVPMGEWTPEQRDLLDPVGTGLPTLNLYMTLVRSPALYRPRAVQSAYIRTGSTLSGRARELLILRIGWLCGAEYAWAQHVRAARREGMTDDEIRDVAVGPTAARWAGIEAALLQTTDELYRDDTISDTTWSALAATYGDQELIDVVITVGGYRMVSMVLNSLGTQLEPDREGFPNVPR